MFGYRIQKKGLRIETERLEKLVMYKC